MSVATVRSRSDDIAGDPDGGKASGHRSPRRCGAGTPSRGSQEGLEEMAAGTPNVACT